jgi:hypothetical protein
VIHIQLSHLSAALLFSLFASIVFGIAGKEGARAQFRYTLKCFGGFLLLVFVGGWALWLLKH